jgi:hypothetical protein
VLSERYALTDFFTAFVFIFLWCLIGDIISLARLVLFFTSQNMASIGFYGL